MGWTIGNFYLTESRMRGNAIEVYNYFTEKGWTLNAIAGILETWKRSPTSIRDYGRA